MMILRCIVYCVHFYIIGEKKCCEDSSHRCYSLKEEYNIYSLINYEKYTII